MFTKQVYIGKTKKNRLEILAAVVRRPYGRSKYFRGRRFV